MDDDKNVDLDLSAAVCAITSLGSMTALLKLPMRHDSRERHQTVGTPHRESAAERRRHVQLRVSRPAPRLAGFYHRFPRVVAMQHLEFSPEQSQTSQVVGKRA